jgi:hypothetical protein
MNRRVREVDAILRDGEAIDRAIIAAHRRVILRHRQLNVPLVVWRDGKVMEIPASDVELPPADDWQELRTG